MKTLLQFSRKCQVLQTIICVTFPLGFLSCQGTNGSRGRTPTVIVAGAQCSTTGNDLRVVILNSFPSDARMSEYTNAAASTSPTQAPSIYCRSGQQFWYNTSPVIAPSNALAQVSLSCASLSDPARGSTDIGCNIGPAQPIECYVNPMLEVTTMTTGIINISTTQCVDDLTPLLKQSVFAILEKLGGAGGGMAESG